MSVEEVCRKYNTDCVQVWPGCGLGPWELGRRSWGLGPLGLREEGLGTWTPGPEGGGAVAGVLSSGGLVKAWGARVAQGGFCVSPLSLRV